MPEVYDDDTLLTRDMAAAALTEAGYPVKSKTLATKATRGGGPPYRLFGVRPLYRWGDALAWAQGRLSAPRRGDMEVCRIAVPQAQRGDPTEIEGNPLGDPGDCGADEVRPLHGSKGRNLVIRQRIKRRGRGPPGE